MGTYESRFATRGVVPRVGGERRAVKRAVAALSVVGLIAAGVFGLWRATLGVPSPSDPAHTVVIDQ